MGAAALCYFIVCFSLNQCQTYYDQIGGLLPEQSDVSMFYWQNPTEIEPTASQISLTEMRLTSHLPAITHWKMMHSGAMDWMPYYYYYQNPEYDGKCSEGYVKLDPMLLFSQPGIDYEQVFLDIVSVARGSNALMASFESACYEEEDPVHLDSASILLDLERFIQVINNYQHAAASQDQHFYLRGAAEKYLDQETVQLSFPTVKLDYADCIDTSTTITLTETIPPGQDSYPFMRTGPNTQVNGDEYQGNIHVVGAGAASSDTPRAKVVFF